MKYLLDTDHLSILQRQTGLKYDNLSRKMANYPLSDFFISIVTLQEQMLGCHAFINRARHPTQVIKGYEIMTKLVNDFKKLPLLSFEQGAANWFDQIQSQNLRLAKMDARIAAITLANGLILLTCNRQDFCKVPNLSLEDWTI
jgi:tRNA(fMet)-specific endonuclease VapC